MEKQFLVISIFPNTGNSYCVVSESQLRFYAGDSKRVFEWDESKVMNVLKEVEVRVVEKTNENNQG